MSLAAVALAVPLSACSEPQAPNAAARYRAAEQAEGLLTKWGCKEVRPATPPTCGDKDLRPNFGVSLDTYELWAERTNDYADKSREAFVLAECRSFWQTSTEWTHVILERQGAWSLLTSSERLADGALADGGMDLTITESRQEVCSP